MRKLVANYIRRNRDALLAQDYKLATLLGAPRGLTLSANAWRLQVLQRPRGAFWRESIDAIWLELFGDPNHCETAYREDVLKLHAACDQAGFAAATKGMPFEAPAPVKEPTA